MPVNMYCMAIILWSVDHRYFWKNAGLGVVRRGADRVGVRVRVRRVGSPVTSA